MKRRPNEGTVRIGTFAALPEVLEQLGADPAELLHEAGLDLSEFENPDNRVSFEVRGRLFSHCVARTGCGHLGLLVGQRGGLHSFGLVGSLMKHAPDVRMALNGLVSFMRAHVRGAAAAVTVDDGTALLSYDIYLPGTSAIDQIADGAVAIMLNIMRELCGPDWKPLEVRFAHRRPEDDRPFRRFFPAPLRFDSEQNGLMFSAHWLDEPLPNSEPELGRLLQRQIEALQSTYSDEFPEQVRIVLRTGIPSGHFSAEKVAALFSIGSRTLNRRLTAAGMGFRSLVNEERYEIARQLLATSALEVNQIAVSLGYGRASAFTRAFRQWSGMTPTAWRVRHAGREKSAGAGLRNRTNSRARRPAGN